MLGLGSHCCDCQRMFLHQAQSTQGYLIQERCLLAVMWSGHVQVWQVLLLVCYIGVTGVTVCIPLTRG